MPFDFKKYDAKCAAMNVAELQREWEHYTRLISGSATSTAVSGLAMPFTLGVSGIGVGLASASIHNARKKRQIIDKYLAQQGAKHQTRKRDVFAPMAVSGTVGVVTLGVGSAAADAITNQAAEHAFTTIAENELAVKVTTHLALDAAVMKGEEEHMKNKKAQENLKAERKASLQQGIPVISLPGNETKVPSAVDAQAPLPKPPRPVSQLFEQPQDLQTQFDHLSMKSSTLGPSRPVTPLPPYAPSAAVFANDTKPPDGATIYLPPPPPNVRRLSTSSVSTNDWTLRNDQYFSQQDVEQSMPGSLTASTRPVSNLLPLSSVPASSAMNMDSHRRPHPITDFDERHTYVTSTMMGMPTPMSPPVALEYQQGTYSPSYFPPPPSGSAPSQQYISSITGLHQQETPVFAGQSGSYRPFQATPISTPVESGARSSNVKHSYFSSPQPQQMSWQHPPTPPMYFPPPPRNG